ncbi:MAG: trehalase family glycosidase [Bacteroidota bacterium]
MNPSDYAPHIQLAQQTLLNNWKDGFTIPTDKLYPFQWNWDSGFTTLGYVHFDPQKAIQELRSLFSGQWENGMIPHIIFHSKNERTYFPNWDFWSAELNKGAPTEVATSGITQPPVHGFILEKLLSIHGQKAEFQQLAKDLFPKIVHSHRFFYTYRDPHQEGLAFVYHPWESGRDNSPIWDEAMNRIQIAPDSIPAYERKDTQLINSEERPTQDKYDRYVYLLELGKKYAYDGPEIAIESPLLVQDCMLNAILIASNDSLIRIGKILGEDTAEVEAWQEKATKAFEEKLWNEELQTYCSYDLKLNNHIKLKEIGRFVSLFAGICKAERANLLIEELSQMYQKGYLLCPSFEIAHPLFDPKRYWRGPVWPQMNWMIYHGLKRSGQSELAEKMRADFLSIISKLGFFEYFDPNKAVLEKAKQGYGGNHFSWTAACYLDLMLAP